MGYDRDLPANQLGGQIFLWDVIEYGSPGIWDRRESTVQDNVCAIHSMLDRIDALTIPSNATSPIVHVYSRSHL